ncbi:hypothetical protein RRG08_063954 [Elysia crispata]|uniref:Uncharacterized protein n=1 Tax=Elysia crispata TaxID=231223 RepID=A0AAE0YEQ2_9GAST|nr:hypothetical protein RRG08_063954 [Elysia crispata]
MKANRKSLPEWFLTSPAQTKLSLLPEGSELICEMSLPQLDNVLALFGNPQHCRILLRTHWRVEVNGRATEQRWNNDITDSPTTRSPTQQQERKVEPRQRSHASNQSGHHRHVTPVNGHLSV